MGMTISGTPPSESLNGVGSRFQIGVQQAGTMAGQILVRQMQKGVLSPPKTGRVYGMHQASAPGEYSANKSGALLNSGRSQMRGRFLYFYSEGCDWAGWQEYGTKRGLQPRPNFGNAVRDADGAVHTVLDQVTMRYVSGA